MAENLGTQVIAKIVTPDSEDTFATHSSETGQGGFHQKSTHALMLAITTERRLAGMEVRVTDDPTPEKNGKYKLENDLTTFTQIDGASTLLGTPPDDGWGDDTSGTTHSTTGVATGDNKEVYVDKMLSVIDKLIPEGPEGLDLRLLTIPNVWSANKQGEASHTPIDNISGDTQPTGVLDGSFGDARQGEVRAVINAIIQGAITLTNGAIGDDNGTNGALTLFGEQVYNQIYQVIEATIQAQVPLSLNNDKHTYKVEHESNSTEVDLYIDNPESPDVLALSLEGEALGVPRFVSGVPSLAENDALKSSFTLDEVVSWYYNLTTLARVESDYAADADTGLKINLNQGVQVPFVDFVIDVLNMVYTENADIDVTAYNSRALTSEEQLGDKTTVNTVGSTGPIRIDTVSDESITVTSGAGQYPLIGIGGAGESFNGTEDLNTVGNEELMMVNGVIKWPEGDFTLNKPTAGPNYSLIPIGSYSGYRWRTFDLGNIASQNFATFNINDIVNFTGTPIESGVLIQVAIEGDTNWLDANTAYPGVGNPVNNGDAALDAASSTNSFKRVTFGTQVRTGRLLVRIGLEPDSTKTFKSIS